MRIILIIIIFMLLISCNRNNYNCEVEHIKVINGLVGDRTVISYTQSCDASLGSDECVNVAIIEPHIDIRHEKGNILSIARSNYIDIKKIAKDTVAVFILPYDKRDIRVKTESYRGIIFQYIPIETTFLLSTN